MASDSARREDHFQKKNCPKRTFPSNFVKLVSKILYLFLAEKWSFVVLFCCFVLFCFVLFVATLSDFRLLFFLIEALIEPGPFFFHGFLRPISRAREIENDAFHGHFTG